MCAAANACVLFCRRGANECVAQSLKGTHTQHKDRNLSLETGKGVVVILTRRSLSLSSTHCRRINTLQEIVSHKSFFISQVRQILRKKEPSCFYFIAK